MNDNFEKQLDEIRIELYEERKDMSSTEKTKLANENGRRIAEEYGIVISKKTPPKSAAKKASGE